MKLLITLLLSTLILNALDPTQLREKAISRALVPIPDDYETLVKLIDDSDNPMSIEKIKLGKKLFFDKNLSKSKKIACAKCHDIHNGGEDGLPTAIGHNKLANPSHLNSPTVLNTAFSKHLFWDGRSPSLRDQAKGPTQAPFEMASTPKLIEDRVKQNSEYPPMFEKAFGSKESINFDNITKAIAVYEKTLVTRADFDEFLEGDDNALSPKAQRGLELFIDLGCKGCHFGYAIGGQKMQKFPLRDYNSILKLTTVYDSKTKKRHLKDFTLNFKMYHPYPFENIGGFLGKDATRTFRVPILRNITQSGPYFHNGIVKDLKDAIFLMGRHQIGVDLDDEQVDEIEAFLKSLEGDLVDFDFDFQ